MHGRVGRSGHLPLTILRTCWNPRPAKHPAMARNLFATLRAMLNWAARKRDYRPLPNPCDGVDTEMLGAKSNRERVLSHDEVRLLVRNVRRLPQPFRALYLVLLLTGLRLNEVARAKWTEFDFDNRIWQIPATRMKGKLPHARTFSTPEFLDITRSIPKSKNAFVFSTNGGESPVAGFSKLKSRLSVRMNRSLKALARQRGETGPFLMHPWVNHDIRRSFRTEFECYGQ